MTQDETTNAPFLPTLTAFYTVALVSPSWTTPTDTKSPPCGSRTPPLIASIQNLDIAERRDACIKTAPLLVEEGIALDHKITLTSPHDTCPLGSSLELVNLLLL